MPQRLEVFQSIWSMQQRRPDGFCYGHEEQFEMIAAADYDGVGIDFAWSDVNDARKHLPLMEKYNLGCALIAFPATVEDLQGVINLASEFDTRYIAINARYFPWTPEEAISRVNAWLEMGSKAGIPVYLETHRLTLTNDIVFTLNLMDLIPELEMVADLSHIVVAREFPEPVDELHNDLIRRILQRTASMQGRISSREQVQIPLGFPQHAYWESQYAQWWQQGFQCWRERSDDNAVMNFLCELGPPPYAITGQDGFELTDRWQEGLMIKDRVREIWQSMESV
ncbi:MAG: hypothetical protein ACI8P9_000933 [Parasphingorhabdus sp.]|jgi:hypothetical protein